MQGNLNEFDGYDCSVCKNRGEVSVIVDGEIRSRLCEKCTPIRKSLKNLKLSGLDKLDFSNFNVCEDWQAKLLDMGKKYVEEIKNEWFYVGGQNGAGKTHICTAVSRSLIYKYGVEVQYSLARAYTRVALGNT